MVTATGAAAPAGRDADRAALGFYRRLPEEVRRCLRPLNLVEECASFMPTGLRAGVVGGAEMSRRLSRLASVRYPVRHLVGAPRGGDGPLSVLLAVDELSARYWRRTFFAGEPRERMLGTVSALRVPGTLRRLAPAADLSLWQTSWPVSALVRGLPRVPSTVPLWLATDRSLDAVILGETTGRSSRKNDARRVRRLGLTLRVSTAAREVERFRRELYEPYTSRRFGELFAAVPPHAFRHAARNGWLLFLECEGRAVAGALLERFGRDVRILAFGVDVTAIEPALGLEACYYHAIGFATDAQLPRLSLGTCRPVLTDGVLRYKRKWGARIGAPTSWDAYVLRYRNTPATRAALTAAPLVVRLRKGRLVALVGAAGVPASQLRQHARRVSARGLAELACLVDDAVPPEVADATLRVVPAGVTWPPAASA